MPGASQAVVTPAGVRDGDPAALRALIARRGNAVLAFCEAVCERDVAPLAAAEAMARFRAAVGAAEEPGHINPEPLLLGATRHAAASLARVPSGGSVLRGRLRARDREACADVPLLLAGRAEDLLGPDDLDRLAHHIETCPACREIEAAFRRAERAYRSPPERPLPEHIEQQLLVALAGAAPLVAPGSETLGDLLDREPDLWAAEPPAADIAPETEQQADAEPGAPPEPPSLEAEAVPEAEAATPEPEPEPEAATPEREAEAATPEPEPEAATPEAAPPAPDLEAAGLEPVRDPGPPLPPVHAPLSDPHEVPTGVIAALPADALPARSPGGLPRTRRHIHLPHPHLSGDHGPLFRYVLPATAIALAIVIILAISGVFGGNDPAPAQSAPAIAIAHHAGTGRSAL